jgi:hypothetical protein
VDAFIKTGGSYAKLDHLTAMEICSISPLLQHALDELSKLQKVVRIFMNFFERGKKNHISAEKYFRAVFPLVLDP